MYFRASDHYEFHKRGIPVVFFFDGIHQDFHKPGDDPEKIEYDALQRVAMLAYHLTMELANRNEPPCPAEESDSSLDATEFKHAYPDIRNRTLSPQ
jgi:hypothetical protein